MRFSLQSLAICLLSSQARFALAGPCRPLTTTAVGATTATATSKELSTTATLSEEPTTTVGGETSTVAVSVEPTTITTLAEELTTTTAAETATAAETTTTASAAAPSLYAQYDDDSEVGAYFLGGSSAVSTEEEGSVKADFALETDTSRLYVSFPDGSKLYAFTVIPNGPNFRFRFNTYDNINDYPNVYHFITCTVDSELFLTCSSEVGPTRIYWYRSAGTTNFFGNSDSNIASSFGNAAARFRLPASQ